MRSLKFFKIVMVSAGALLASACLVSETPILDAENGAATPLKPGPYTICSIDDGADEDCNEFAATHEAAGLYRFESDDEKPGVFRFRKVARRGYAVQSAEDDDAYAYYYGRLVEDRFQLTMMMCQDLPADLRARLIKGGDLSSGDDNFETCTVNTLKGLTAAAKAYHRGEAGDDAGDGDVMLEFRPSSDKNGDAQ